MRAGHLEMLGQGNKYTSLAVLELLKYMKIDSSIDG